ncbi:hypothetical protein UFOVP450_53 [uncultured Caudovirales phage]|uniref:Glycosyl transferase, family 11 n=1 Tax=uncultured Caudovirales phage TaxID=2100421 RepID=A0A6J5M9Z2_9CAUD|nr:hypothetical protein UFOVP450_53 [uncultured Caudovirales phage]
MITTEFYHGQGFGNQLAVYITTRAIALRNGYEFGFTGLENFGDRRYNDKGVYFMDLDLGKEVDSSTITNHYREKETRIKLQHSHHDATIGCDVRIIDEDLINVADNTKVDGVLQGEDYFYEYKQDIKRWLELKPEYDERKFTSDNICVLNIRDYENDPTLFLGREYWIRAINHMLSINPKMEFVIITEAPEMSKRLLPELAHSVYHFDIARDYAVVKNARWLILSNSSFAYFPALTNEEARLIIAPKYWARHNVSDGYWACGYNICRDFTYMDRAGNLQTYDECLREFQIYKIESNIYG